MAHRSAIVTGAGSGIGHAVALELAANGASVIVADLVEAPLTTLLEETRAAGGTAEKIVGDVCDSDFALACVADANALAPLRIAVNNAGIGGEQSLIGDYSLDGWRTVIEVNLNAVFYGLRTQLPSMARNGGGSIINMASILGSVGFATSSAYVTAKHALGRLGTPQEVSALVCFLASDAASLISGSYHLVDGGYVAQWYQ